MKRRLVAWAVAALIMEGCGHVKPPPPAPPDDPFANCALACSHMLALGCRAGQPTAKGESCEAVCNNVMTSSIVTWNLACISNASDCGAVNVCNP
jgi:hypothetical protein